ncbi:MAG: DedA family protein [Hyphomicrobiaceae bacterium]
MSGVDQEPERTIGHLACQGRDPAIAEQDNGHMSISGLFGDLVNHIKDYIAFAAPIVFLLGLGEGIPALSIFIPSTALFLAIGSAHGAAGGQFATVWLAASLGAVLGDCIAYGLGRWLRDDVAKLRYFAVHPGALTEGHRVFERWGVVAVLAGKFMGFVRPFVPVVAGIVTMPWPLFLAASIASSMAWAGVFLAPGYGLTWFMH